MKHSLLFRVLWFRLNCVLLHRVCCLFLTFVTFPLFLHYLCSVVALLRQYLVCCDIFKTVFRQRFRTLGNSALQQTNLSKKDKHLGGMEGKIEENLSAVCFTHLCVPMPSPDHDSVRKWVPPPVGYRLSHIGLVPRYQKCNWQIGMYLFWLLPLLIKM